MTDALTARSWIATLRFLRDGTTDETTRTLARMMIEVIEHTNDPVVGRILDAYGARLMAGQQ